MNIKKLLEIEEMYYNLLYQPLFLILNSILVSRYTLFSHLAYLEILVISFCNKR
jgi:hypothetical protein